MRIVSGRLGGRRFPGPTAGGTRPTSERAREGIASALEAHRALASQRVCDLYAGTGALGFEALSRGARELVCVEREPRVARALEASAAALGVAREVQVLCLDLERQRGQRALLALGPFGLVFADPPYAELQRALSALGALCHGGLLAEDAVLLLEHAAKDTPVLPVELSLVTRYRYGDTAFSWLVPAWPPDCLVGSK